MSWQGQVALITGGNQNYGAARDLVRNGANVAIHHYFTRSETELAAIRDDLMKHQPKARISFHTGDLNSASAVEELFSDVLLNHGKVDMVVHSVGVVKRQALPGSLDTEYDRMLAYAVFIDEQRRRCVQKFHTESMRN